eukprot:gene5130-5778_t
MGDSKFYSSRGKSRRHVVNTKVKPKSNDRRPIDSRGISTSKTTKYDSQKDADYSSSKSNQFQNVFRPERRLPDCWNDNDNTNQHECKQIPVTPKAQPITEGNLPEMVKKNLTIAQMCNFYRAAGLSTAEQNLRQHQGRSMHVQLLSEATRNHRNLQANDRPPHPHERLKYRKSDGIAAMKADHKQFRQSLISSRETMERSSFEDVEGSTTRRNYSHDERRRKEQTIFLTDESMRRIQQASSVYVDDGRIFRKQRRRRIEETINTQQRQTFEKQLYETKKELDDQLRRNITNVTELRKVRKRYLREKQKRVNTTYVSIAALEMPEVDRYAYGLPAEGKEYTLLRPSKTLEAKEMVRKKWESSIKKTNALVKMIDLSKKIEKSRTLPILKPLPSNATGHRGRKKSEEEEEGENTSKDEFNTTEFQTMQQFIDLPSFSSINEGSELDFDDEDL